MRTATHSHVTTHVEPIEGRLFLASDLLAGVLGAQAAAGFDAIAASTQAQAFANVNSTLFGGYGTTVNDVGLGITASPGVSTNGLAVGSGVRTNGVATLPGGFAASGQGVGFGTGVAAGSGLSGTGLATTGVTTNGVAVGSGIRTNGLAVGSGVRTNGVAVNTTAAGAGVVGGVVTPSGVIGGFANVPVFVGGAVSSFGLTGGSGIVFGPTRGNVFASTAVRG
jgi:hypothetical protein